MKHKLSEKDPLYYRAALRGLFDQAKENGVTVSIKENRVVFDDRKEFMGGMVSSTVCSVETDFYESPDKKVSPNRPRKFKVRCDHCEGSGDDGNCDWCGGSGVRIVASLSGVEPLGAFEEIL